MEARSSKKRVFIGITTSPYSNWRSKIKKIDEYGVKEIAFFPTILELKERKEAYALFQETKLQKIPLVHLRHGTEPWEIEYLIKRYKTKFFNTHPEQRCLDLAIKCGKYKDRLYVENLYSTEANRLLTAENIEKYDFAGICLDFTHLEYERNLSKAEYERKIQLMQKVRIGCNHVSAIAHHPREEIINGRLTIDQHTYRDMSEFDYLRGYPLAYFADCIGLELENSIEELIEAKKYIEEIIETKEKND